MKRGKRLKVEDLKKGMRVITYDKDWDNEYRCIGLGVFIGLGFFMGIASKD